MQGWQSASTATAPVIKQGDTLGIELHWVDDTNITGLVMEEVEFPPSAEISMAIGVIEVAPTYGTFTLTFGANETTPLNYNATATDVQNALNALPLIASAGGVTVSLQNRSYRIIFNNAGVISETIGFGDNDLFPTSSIGIMNARVGTALVRAIYQVHIKQSPVAYTETFTNQDQATVSVTVIRSAAFTGDTRVWRVSVSPNPKAGTFVLKYNDGANLVVSNPISVYSTASEVIASIGDEWAVQKSGSFSWDISTPQSYTNLVADGGGILSFNAKYCELSLNTVEVENLLNGASSAVATLEIETVVNGVRSTLIQTLITLVNDLIDEADYTVVSRSEVMPIDSVVRYDTSQSLSEAQKLQARNNIGAVGSSVNVDSLATQVTNLDVRVSTIEGNSLTANQTGAIQADTSASATNPFVTADGLDTHLLGYALVSHTHPISAVTGLQTALTGKAEAVHTHSTEDIAGLDTQLTDLTNSLFGKANTSHTHTLTQINGLSEALLDYVTEDYVNILLSGYVTQTVYASGLNGKANVFHNHSMSAINGLEEQLSDIQFRLFNVENPTDELTNNEFQAIRNSSNPTDQNPFVTLNEMTGYKSNVLDATYVTLGSPIPYDFTTSSGNLTTTIYPYEIKVVIGGQTFAIPARAIP